MLSIKTQTGARISNGNRSVLGVLHVVCPEVRKSQTAWLALKEKLCRLTLKERGKEKRKAYHKRDMPFLFCVVKHKKARLSTSLNGAEGTSMCI